MRRREALVLPIAALLTACEDDPPPAPIVQPDYAYLIPLALKVGVIDTEVTAAASDLAQRSPIDPVAGLRRIGADRLHAAGGDARGVYSVTDASLARSGDGIAGLFGVTLRIFDASGRQVAVADAHAARTRADADDMTLALAELTRQLLDAMNVELEFQVRRSLADWLIPIGAEGPAVPAPVTQTPLGQ